MSHDQTDNDNVDRGVRGVGARGRRAAAAAARRIASDRHALGDGIQPADRPGGTAGAGVNDRSVAAVLSSADLRVRVDRETARGVFSVAGDVLRPGVARVNLLAGATLVDATAGGRPLPLIVEGTAHTALLPGPGPFALTLEWGAPLTFTPGRGSFVLPAPPAGSVRATIDLPGEQADVHLSSGLITRRSASGGRTVVEATLTPGSSERGLVVDARQRSNRRPRAKRESSPTS